MKLPFDFALKFLFRMVLPGALLTALFWPVLVTIRHWLGLLVADVAVIPVAILLFGWLVILLDMQIYTLAEGRRYWPDWLRTLRKKAHERRVTKMANAGSGSAPMSARSDELTLQIRNYPLKRDGTFEAVMPTRLGNLIYASETYPDRKYGIDGVFAWPRLWVVIDKDLRSELDDRQALVDSSLYATFILFLAVPVCSLYAVVQYLDVKWIPITLPSAPLLGGVAFLALLFGLFLYNATIYAQVQYGELFCAVFDQYRDKLEYPALIKDLARHMGDGHLEFSTSREKGRAAVRFLKWHKYRRTGDSANKSVHDW